MDFDQIRRMLEPIEQFVHEHHDQFTAKVAMHEDVWDIAELRFGSEAITFVLITMDGRHIVDSIDWADFTEWYNEME